MLAIAGASSNALLLSAQSSAPLLIAQRSTPSRISMEFGKGFGHYYSGWEDLCKEYPQEDRDTYPALFSLPDNCYEVKIDKPMGIAFIEKSGGGVEGNSAGSRTLVSLPFPPLVDQSSRPCCGSRLPGRGQQCGEVRRHKTGRHFAGDDGLHGTRRHV